MEHYKSNLKIIREKNGVSQEELSEHIGVNRKTIIAIESIDGANPRIDTVIKLLAYFDITFEELYSKELK